MIIEALIWAVSGLIAGVGSLMPQMETPAFLTSIAGHVATITAYIAPLGHWVPFAAITTAIGVVLAAFAVAVVVRLVRIVASFLTAGGGGAA